MADLNDVTMDVTLFDDNSGNYADINANHELLVHDDHGFAVLDGDRWQTSVKYGRGFSTVNEFVTISGQAETDFLLITNPTGSGKIAYFEEWNYTYNKGAGISILRAYSGPTITANGTAQSVVKLKPSSAISTALSVYRAPTISARGTLTRIVGQSAVGSFVYHTDLGAMLESNSSLLLTIQPAANNTDHSLFVEWEEQ
jgi:hypothetical protein